VAKGVHTINLVCSNNGNIDLVAVEAYDSTTPAIDLFQAGQNGAKAADIAGAASAWSPLNALGAFAPDMSVICLTINDSNNATALSSYTTSLQAIITKAKLSGDVLLMVGVPSGTTAATDGTLDGYIAVCRSLATLNNVGLLDLTVRWTSYAAANPAWPYFDTAHPGPSGYADVAKAVLAAITV
jgi:lysophospholipase L1-like esterase